MTRIYVVEDDQLIQFTLVMLLEDAGFVVVGTAETEDEAVAGVLSTRPDLVILDVTLKDHGNGVAVARRLRAAKFDAHLLFMTAYNDRQLEADIAETRPVGRFSKPYDEDALVEFIRRL